MTLSVRFYSSDIYISYLPLAHIYERANQIMCAYYGGVVGFYQGDNLKLMDDLAALRPTIYASVPRLYNRIYAGKGWQLMALCPKDNRIAWFCCMGKRPKKTISEKIETAFDAYQVMKGKRAKDKPKWVYPKCYKQNAGDDECGLFVMRHMLEIIKLDIVNSFEEVLNMEEPYSNNDIDDVRTHWAECFLEVIT